MTQQKDTRFRPGTSGNPQGRAPGSGWIGAARKQLQAAWDGAEKDGGDGIRHKLIERAKEGDLQAIRLVAERVCPPLRPVDEAAPIVLPEGTLTERANAVLASLATGELPVSTAAQLLSAIGSLAKVLELDEVVRRLEALERAQGAER